MTVVCYACFKPLDKTAVSAFPYKFCSTCNVKKNIKK